LNGLNSLGKATPFIALTSNGSNLSGKATPLGSLESNASSRHSKATSQHASKSNTSNLTRKVSLRMMYLVRRASLRNIILRYGPSSRGLSVVRAAFDLRYGRMHFQPPPVGGSNFPLHRTALMPYCGEVSTSANVDCIGELVDGLQPGWLRSPQNVNASPLPCNRAGTSPLRALVAKAPKALRYAPQKIGIRPSWPHLFLSGPPALATATHGPTGIVPFGRAGDESSPPVISHWNIR
jgi:hypothetical protein